jgi:general secretion pathway protein A
MYEKYFHLDERPFSIAPDPRFLFMSARHREALAHLLYGVGEGGGFVQLTGEVGTGKTTLCRALLEQLPANVDVALILNPKVTAQELIATLCDELRVTYPEGTGSIKTLTDALNRQLLAAHAAGRRTVLVIDEAQNLSPEVLEQVRLLTNLETAREKLLQVILIGQPELRTLLAREDLRQLAQRITARYHLEPMNRVETEAYVLHRLQVCGATGRLFSRGALDALHRLSGGVPRLINVLADRALLGAYVEGEGQVSAKVLRRAAREVLPAAPAGAAAAPWGWALAISLAGGLALAGWWWQPWVWEAGATRAATIAAASPAASAPTAMVAAELPAAADGAEKAQAEARWVALLEAAAAAGEDAAWHGLLARWGVEAQGGSGAQLCQQLAEHGLHCLSRSGSWQAVRNAGHPALLYLMGPEGRRLVVVLHGIDGHEAILAAGQQPVRVPITRLQQAWFGDYALVWQSLPGGATLLRAGDTGEAVRWVREQLDAPVLTAADYFDDGLQAAIVDFQRRHQLEADGVVGPRTIMQLHTLSTRPMPRLVQDAD